jgi:hypothetical protein
VFFFFFFGGGGGGGGGGVAQEYQAWGMELMTKEP